MPLIISAQTSKMFTVYINHTLHKVPAPTKTASIGGRGDVGSDLDRSIIRLSCGT